ncbi:hypothetical protein COCCADRAFT_30181 [Bipolaris zeicola 26-R-13]|uniref:Carbohydrate-binding module family 18 protein n=1 Tax=Cochliobolus carbonum (strain 26-R-13) TaxID=930089 RepID=W6Y0R1_COCC2|nr:uncharacterized protein COCCADRAFT_30181 [Bipolaris zeicola 26-R-13]EUC28589.1 hypothetical protein COCCADRAFT_30181 [Bipolaris zeicola 26-R-13]
MRYSFFALATAGVLASAQSTIPLGENCTPGGTPCAGGANCYATNSMLQPLCGNFQSSCTSDAQCAFNTCNGGFCNGVKASSSSTPPTVTSSSSAPGWSPAPSPTIVAPAGSLSLGAECNPFVTPSQCIEGVQCWASNAGLIARCGNFNAACKTDAQCAYNTCNNGLCNGLRASSSGLPVASSSGLPVASSKPVPGTISIKPTPSSGSGGNGTVNPSHTPSSTSSGTPEFTGAASAEKVAGGIFAIVFGAIALGL